MIFPDGSRCAHRADWKGLCRWHLAARAFSKGKMLRPESVARVRRVIWLLGLLLLLPTGWELTKSPSIPRLLSLVFVLGMAVLVSAYASC